MLWKPRASYSINSNMQKFLNHIALRYDLPGNDYRTVHGWSIENTKEFWAEIWDYCNVIYSKNYESVVDNPKKMPGALWFKGSRLNFTVSSPRNINAI